MRVGWQGLISTVGQLFFAELPVLSALKEILCHTSTIAHRHVVYSYSVYLSLYPKILTTLKRNWSSDFNLRRWRSPKICTFFKKNTGSDFFVWISLKNVQTDGGSSSWGRASICRNSAELRARRSSCVCERWCGKRVFLEAQKTAPHLDAVN